MILYVTLPKHTNQFDRIIGDEVMNKYVGEYQAESFLLKDFAYLGHFDKIILDLEAFTDTEEEFLDVLKSFQLVSDSQIILYAPVLEIGDSLIRKLIEIEIYNIIIEKEYEAFQEIAMKVLDTPMTKEEAEKLLGEERAKETSNHKEYIFINTRTQITVAGMGDRAGASTTALTLAYQLTKKGAKVAVVLFDKDEKLKDIAKEYQFEEIRELFYEKEGMLLLSSSVTISNEFDNLNFIILEIGAITKEKMIALENAKHSIIVSYSKLSDNVQLKDFFAANPDLNTNLLFRSAEEKKKAVLKKEYEKYRVYFMDYTTSYLDEMANEDFYNEILTDYMIKRKN